MSTLVFTAPATLARVTYVPGQEIEADDALIEAAVLAGVGYAPAPVVLDWWGAPGRILAAEPADTVRPYSCAETPGALKIVMGTGYDPGNAAYRFHTAVNETTPHASMFFRWRDSNPYSSIRQYDGERDVDRLRAAIREADVIHCHINYLTVNNAGVKPKSGARIVRHYHGSLPTGGSLVEQGLDDVRGAIQVGARLSLLSESPRMHWLPIAMPVARYRAMARLAHTAEPRAARPFRIAHSPTHRGYKGTEAFLHVVERLQRDGIAIEPVLIEKCQHRAALWRKAACDAVFDSFWLGIQGSGLEGGAMGMPVIAGDATVGALYREHVGHIPYTFAADANGLERALRALVADHDFYAAEANRVEQYVRAFHDYGAVAARYMKILEAAP